MRSDFIIFIETVTGEVIRAFSWSGDKQAGIARAQYDSDKFGFEPVRIWAEDIAGG